MMVRERQEAEAEEVEEMGLANTRWSAWAGPITTSDILDYALRGVGFLDTVNMVIHRTSSRKSCTIPMVFNKAINHGLQKTLMRLDVNGIHSLRPLFLQGTSGNPVAQREPFRQL
jgi:hypothetical protein